MGDIKMSVMLLGLCLLLLLTIGAMSIHMVTLQSIVDAQSMVIESYRTENFHDPKPCGEDDETK